MKNKLFLLREKVFALICLFITAVFCIIKSIISLVRTSKFFDWIIIEFEENPSLFNFKSIKVILITSMCISCLFLLCSFLPLFFKNTNVKRAFIVVGFVILVLVIIFYFVSLFILGDLYTVKNFKNEDFYTSNYYLDQSLTINFEYVVIVAFISLITTILSSNINVESKKEVENEDNIEEISSEEKVMQEEIGKLKAQLRIKDLEKEYLSLKKKLE